MVDYNKLARFLGWFSLGVGLFELLQPKRVQKLVNVRGDYSGVVRALGVREIVHGLLIMLRGRPSQGVWSRVAGDAVDLAVLGAAVTAARSGQNSFTHRIAERGEAIASRAGEAAGQIASRASDRIEPISSRISDSGAHAAERAGKVSSRIAERASEAAGHAAARAERFTSRMADRGSDMVDQVANGRNGHKVARTAARVADRADHITSRAAEQAGTLTDTVAERAVDIGSTISRFIAERFGRRLSRRERARRAAMKAARGAASTARDAASNANRFMGDFSSRAGKAASENRTALLVAALLGVTALDLLTATQLTRQRSRSQRYAPDFQEPYLAHTRSDLSGRTPDGAFKVTRSVTINRPADELYRFWRDFHNLPQFMYHLKDVHVLDERRSHWVAKAPAGTQVEWEAEITEDRPGELIAWQSLPGADVPNRGQVRFMSLLNQPGSNNATEVRVEIEYHPPAGALGKAVAKLFGEDPTQQVAGDLQRFKQVMETGEVVRSEGSRQGYGQKSQDAARPERE